MSERVTRPLAKYAVQHAFERHHGDERECTAYGYCHFGACLRREDDPIHVPASAPERKETR